MAESVAQRIAAVPDSRTANELYALFEALRADVVALRAAVLEMGTKLDAETLSASDFNEDAATTLGTISTNA